MSHYCQKIGFVILTRLLVVIIRLCHRDRLLHQKRKKLNHKQGLSEKRLRRRVRDAHVDDPAYTGFFRRLEQRKRVGDGLAAGGAAGAV